ncbi:MAG: YgaP family membrane protein [Janthinobacterium lividum]
MITDDIKKATDTVKETLTPISEEFKKVTDTLKETLLPENPNANVGKTDRIISVGTGAYIFFKGVTNLFSSPILALTEVSIGAGLLHRGITGNCAIKKVIDDLDETDETAVAHAYPYPASSVSQL